MNNIDDDMLYDTMRIKWRNSSESYRGTCYIWNNTKISKIKIQNWEISSFDIDVINEMKDICWCEFKMIFV